MTKREMKKRLRTVERQCWTTANVLRQLLDELGYKVTTDFTTGRFAYKQIEKFPPREEPKN